MTSDQLALAFEDRHAGQAANLAAGTSVLRDDRGRVETAVAELARFGTPFTADHVHNALHGGDPYDPNLVSSVMGVWAQDGRIVEHDSRPTASERRTRRASRNRWWVGGANIPEARQGSMAGESR
ncbi:MAG TPA: hypothetical protein VFV67_33945 [Actinophytocola sp.]|uniref:hypothetical protein n=1 Tax=Actinophytocola sp. TaxID=1872138 RepID=UPI002DB667E6|nr:hypothetical protein [Actinophytocola sp.]HEU5475670.1 hypothetical protein [Actinophytocola sp.]